MRFDELYDLEKSAATQRNRGIDFLEARAVWDDPFHLRDIPARVVEGEDRWIAVGKVAGRLWTVCYTYRRQGIRIISVRPPRQDEKEHYDG